MVLVLALLAGCGGGAPEADSPGLPAEPETTTEAAPPETTTEAEDEAEVEPQEPEPEPGPRPLRGLPRYTAGYDSWTKLNAEPIPPRASDPHNGTKNVFVSREPRGDGLFPNGTVVVKEAMRPGADFIGLIAVMRKQRGADPAHNDWVFIEWTREAPRARFQELARGAVCWGCHAGAADRDYVFTLRP